MSLGIVIKGSEGVVLAADSRVTLLTPSQGPANQVVLIPVNFDNATKLLTVTGQDYIGAVTYGLGALMTADGPRTMHSFIPQFEEDLKDQGASRLSVPDFAKRLSDFFMGRWDTLVHRPANPGEEINFLVGGFDVDAAYGRAYQFKIPTAPTPEEQNAGAGQFGMTWGGQFELVNRMLFGFDLGLPEFIGTTLKLPPNQMEALKKQLEQRFDAGIPYPFLPLQDCVNLAVFLIESTVRFQAFSTRAVRGVGGPVEVATITRLGLTRVLGKHNYSVSKL